ncbi:MAG: ATP phosphoribosyltransferase [Parcubacteria group bacterium CG2_30_36_18]|uniref:ATP phosphoribosyltransferase n=2 Tax=Candidatus Nealsoniibacteriota TaxID=1817911 RepID=A0A2M8DM24_9BACT|nr:MAG: ATP phosphoribosyltransferase [Parcubacteria group bacterium CG2_30_36_18]PIX88637.1 MAG: ATP phosphoribosyltransferase [Candidatus Nealsonbacteria bacterium CG_4_10_14_3_um_filter_36_16]PJB99007.1 MAG: ATP phosphoribosyltransferase [Candidatus Nealsonbacteria bacterium CG_4_9_14_0_8_um_filter_36_17]
MEEKKLKLGIPKGSLQERTLKIFQRAGFEIEVPERRYILNIDDPEIECLLLRPQEIPKYVEKGKLDVGLSGDDCILEAKAKVIEVCDLRYTKQIKRLRWVLAVPKDSKIKSIKDLQGKIISTEAVNLVKDYLKKNKVKAKIEFSWGATEVKPPRFSDAIIDLTETGASLRAHNLKIIDTILLSSTKLITNKSTWQDKWKQEKIKDLALLLQGAVKGEEVVSLMMHVPGGKLKTILKVLPKLKSPTIKKLTGENWYDVTISCDTKETRELIPRLKRMGCQGIVEFPINKIVR